MKRAGRAETELAHPPILDNSIILSESRKSYCAVLWTDHLMSIQLISSIEYSWSQTLNLELDVKQPQSPLIMHPS